MHRPFNVAHPFLRPAWRRALAVAATLGWTAIEALNGAWFWAVLFGAAGLWLLYSYFIAFDPADYERPGKGDGPS